MGVLEWLVFLLLVAAFMAFAAPWGVVSLVSLSWMHPQLAYHRLYWDKDSVVKLSDPGRRRG